MNNKELNPQQESAKISRKEQKEIARRQHEELVASMSKEEYATMQLEEMRYQNNKLSHMLGYLGVAGSLLACFFSLPSISPQAFFGGAGTIIIILLNIVVLLFGFLCAEKSKVYDVKYSKYMFGLGAVCIARMFWYPLFLMIWYNQFQAQGGAQVAAAQNAFKTKLGTTVLETYQGWFFSSGNIRAIVIWLILGVAAFGFIFGGYVGVKRGTKLHNYVESLGKKN